MVGRGAKRKGTRYFGPYSHAWAIRETVDLLLRVFPMRSCSNGVFKRSGQIGRPCLLGYIDKCAAPCVGNVTADEHRAIVDDFCDFMAGNTTAFIRRIEREMYAASEALDFEKAARLRDDLGALNKALEKQAVVLGDGTDADVIALAEDPLEVAVQIFYVRGGRIRGQRGWVADRSDDSDTAGLVQEFLLQLYGGVGIDDEGDTIPREVLVPALPPDAGVLEELLSERRGSRVAIRVPQRGDKSDAAGDRRVQRRAVPRAPQDQARQRPHHPQPRAGGDPEGARPRRGAAAHRVLRRLQPAGHRGGRLDGGLRGRAGAQERVPPLRDPRGRRAERRRPHAPGHHPAVPAAARRAGQSRGGRAPTRVRCSSTRRRAAPASSPTRRGWSSSTADRPRSPPPSGALAELGITDIPVCGLAKRLEEVWLPAEEDPVIMARTSEGLYLLQRVRDEAHRFAITHHRSAALEVDGREHARRRARPGRGAPQDAAQALRLAQEAARGRCRRDRAGAGHRAAHGVRDQGGGREGRRHPQDCCPAGGSTPPPARSSRRRT